LVDRDNPSDHPAIYSEFKCCKLSKGERRQPGYRWNLCWDKAETALRQTTLSKLVSNIIGPVGALTCSNLDCVDRASALKSDDDVVNGMR
jgi:hypothetical protein